MRLYWTKDKYIKLCEISDKFLVTRLGSITEVANVSLHIIRPHPIFLCRYQYALERIPKLEIINSLAKALMNLLRVCRCLFKKKQYWYGDLSSSPDILIISHLINVNDAGNEKDFYYGQIINELRSIGVSSTIALFNNIAETSSDMALKWTSKSQSIIVLEKFLNFNKELTFYIESIQDAFKLLKKSLSTKKGFEKKLLILSAKSALEGHSIESLRYAEQIQALVEKLKPKALILTYEGHSWERVAFSKVKTVMPNVVCIGYQHAPLFYLQHSIRRKLGFNYDPDIILTSGDVAKNRLKSANELSGVKIDVLGSIRSFEKQKINQNTKDEFTCIVIPEGLESECHLLFKYSFECAVLIPQLNFIWRLHPLISLEKLKHKYKLFDDLPRNIKISRGDMAADLAKSSFALYRGSSAVLQAVAARVYPVYLSVPKEITIDPLFEVEALRGTVREPNDLKNILSCININSKKIDELQFYCEKIFTPMNVGVLKEIIDKYEEQKK
jgi:hypothetical protein